MFFKIGRKECKTCEGTGRVVAAHGGHEHCPKCDGDGFVSQLPDFIVYMAIMIGLVYYIFYRT
jgi:DnaJ-class molecular chaperone